MKKADIVLVSMPFAPFWIPNAGLGVLTSSAKKAGLSVSATYPEIRLGQKIGPSLYNFISENYLTKQINTINLLTVKNLDIKSYKLMVKYIFYCYQIISLFLICFLFKYLIFIFLIFFHSVL